MIGQNDKRTNTTKQLYNSKLQSKQSAVPVSPVFNQFNITSGLWNGFSYPTSDNVRHQRY